MRISQSNVQANGSGAIFDVQLNFFILNEGVSSLKDGDLV